jgi:hypothetical protein
VAKILTNRVNQLVTKRILQPIPNLASHSLRRGGATFLANGNAPDWLIKHMGRWQTDTFKLYTDYTWRNIIDTLAQTT